VEFILGLPLVVGPPNSPEVSHFTTVFLYFLLACYNFSYLTLHAVVPIYMCNSLENWHFVSLGNKIYIFASYVDK